jgi:ADP-dependent NAD(P)H-hydrate dehydratase / NAD(P)H-hydrate epimerase
MGAPPDSTGVPGVAVADAAMPLLGGPTRVDPRQTSPLHSVAGTRRVEALAQAAQPKPSLMVRAGSSVARLAMALHPHAHRIWIAAGPGNNGGDGLEAGAALHRMGRNVILTWLGDLSRMGPDAAAAHARASAAGVVFSTEPPTAADLTIDALLGIGAGRAPDGQMAEWIERMNKGTAPVLSVDLPSGLDGDTGHRPWACVNADATLSLLSLKPGLFTGQGRDASGTVWLDRLGIDDSLLGEPDAWLAGQPLADRWLHATHKGSRGDVAVVGGSRTMHGAALLAARSALCRGAGRVYCVPLTEGSGPADPAMPELMLRELDGIDGERMAVVCGCGGGDAVRSVLPKLLSTVRRLVLDADALNAIAADPALHPLLRARARRDWSTVLTPHPLEAARLAQTDVSVIQADRLSWAARLALSWNCTVVLKGSGSVVAAPESTPWVNPTGGPGLACAGTGDVLAGAIGALLARGGSAFAAATAAVWRHGRCADLWPADRVLTASALANAVWE